MREQASPKSLMTFHSPLPELNLVVGSVSCGESHSEAYTPTLLRRLMPVQDALPQASGSQLSDILCLNRNARQLATCTLLNIASLDSGIVVTTFRVPHEHNSTTICTGLCMTCVIVPMLLLVQAHLDTELIRAWYFSRPQLNPCRPQHVTGWMGSCTCAPNFSMLQISTVLMITVEFLWQSLS